MIEKKERLVALDVFRGLTIASMILVNTPGSWSYIYPPFKHAPWHGITPTDLVFPFFLFAVGAAMSFSLKKYSSSPAAIQKILKRTALIFFIGLTLNAFPFFKIINGGTPEQSWEWINLSNLRIMGVLQRIALSYGLAALLCYFLSIKQLIRTSAVILLGYWAVLLGFGSGDPFSLEGNAVLKLDKLVLGENHLWRGQGIPFDPEGLLSTLPAVVSVIIGFLAGKMVQTETEKLTLVNKFFLLGNGSIFLAMAWGMVFPINKAIWTSSYVLMSSGIALVLIAFMIYFIDVLKKDFWIHPFLVFGRNPLIIFIMSIVVVKIYAKIFTGPGQNTYGWIYQTVFVPVGGNMIGSLLFALFHVVLLWLFGLFLYKKNIIIKV